jgi:hypothetical protein
VALAHVGDPGESKEVYNCLQRSSSCVGSDWPEFSFFAKQSNVLATTFLGAIRNSNLGRLSAAGFLF